MNRSLKFIMAASLLAGFLGMPYYTSFIRGGATIHVTVAVIATLSLPLCCIARSRRNILCTHSYTLPAPHWAGLLIALISLTVSIYTSDLYGDLPPALHDEYSYLFQAETFLDGRLAYSSASYRRELFDQIHVLNNGTFASRYFPGTGLWLAPFVHWSTPYVGQWLAAAASSVLVFCCGHLLSSTRAGFVAGLTMALSPGMAIFANLLTSSQPTLLGISLFYVALLKVKDTGEPGWAVLASIGLTFAFLCRPLTAVSCSLPFGLWFISRLAAHAGWRRRRVQLATAMSAPLICGAAGLLAYNARLTGTIWISPHQLYNTLYTPFHSYGFNNVRANAGSLGAHVDQDYNAWATNLTLPLACGNVKSRLTNSWVWLLGVYPVGCASIATGLLCKRVAPFFWLFPFSIVSLHLAYLPYWFPGVLGWHYVFESSAPWAIIVGLATDNAVNWAVHTRRLLLLIWLTMVGASSVLLNLKDLGLEERPVLDDGIESLRPMRIRHAAFCDLVHRTVIRRPAVVFVPDPPDNMHVDFVLNPPALNSDILIVRMRRSDDVHAALPGRVPYVFNEQRWTISEYITERE